MALNRAVNPDQFSQQTYQQRPGFDPQMNALQALIGGANFSRSGVGAPAPAPSNAPGPGIANPNAPRTGGTYLPMTQAMNKRLFGGNPTSEVPEALRPATPNLGKSFTGIPALDAILKIGTAGAGYVANQAAQAQPQVFGGGGGFGGGFGASAPPSIEDIMAQMPSLDPEGMAQEQFDPQFDMLSQMRSATTGRMNQQADDAQSMYDALAQSIEADKGGVEQSYDTAAQNIDAAFSGARADVQATGDQTNADMNAMMQRLGIGTAAPDTTAIIAEDQNRSLNTIAELGANYAGNNQANESSMMDYLTNQSNTAGLAGANASADVNSALQQMLQEYSAQELGLKGQQQQTENEYAMQIAGMQQDAGLAAADNAWKQYESQLAQQQQGIENSRWDQQFQWDQNMDQSRLEVDRAAEERALQEMLRKAQQGGPEAAQTKDASTIMMQEASKIWPNNDQMSGTAANAIMETIANSPDIQSVADLIEAVGRRFPASNPNRRQYMHLASVYGQAAGL